MLVPMCSHRGKSLVEWSRHRLPNATVAHRLTRILWSLTLSNHTSGMNGNFDEKLLNWSVNMIYLECFLGSSIRTVTESLWLKWIVAVMIATSAVSRKSIFRLVRQSNPWPLGDTDAVLYLYQLWIVHQTVSQSVNQSMAFIHTSRLK